METEIKVITSGSVTSPRGFHAGATCAGIKKGAKDTTKEIKNTYKKVKGKLE